MFLGQFPVFFLSGKLNTEILFSLRGGIVDGCLLYSIRLDFTGCLQENNQVF